MDPHERNLSNRRRSFRVGLALIGLSLVSLALTLTARSTLARYDAIEKSEGEEPRYYIWWEETRTTKLYQGGSGEKKGLFVSRERDMKMGDFIVQCNLNVHQITSTAWENYDQPTWAVYGYLPAHVRRAIPENGRIEDGPEKRAAAETDTRRELEEAGAATRIAELEEKYFYLERYTAAWRSIVDWKGEHVNELPREGALVSILSGRLPRPRKLEDEEHNKVRLRAPGQRVPGEIVTTLFGPSLIADKTNQSFESLLFQLRLFTWFERFGFGVTFGLAVLGAICVIFRRQLGT